MSNSFKTQYIYTAQVYSKILYSILLYFIQMYIWKSINGTKGGEINNLQYMSVYVLISACIGVFIAFDTNYIPIIGERIRSGKIAVDFIKPHSFCLGLFFEYLGLCLFKLLFNLVPLAMILLVMNRGNVGLKAGNLFYFAVSLCFALIIFFLLSMSLGMLSFWVVSVGNLHILLDSMITLFSGSVIPLWFIPEKYAVVYEVLPFKYLFFYPITIFLGKYSFYEIRNIYAGQILWILLLFIISTVVYEKGRHKLQIFGG